ncbi:MAG TPA: hypothetical protein VN726_13985 [Hanamia sp.]|jgi:hypothetical protein|nr:hypothetical protein [Hanamia sp.]
MIAENTSTRFTALQQELLKLFGREVPEEDLKAIKDLIGKYFLDKLQNKVDEKAKEKGYTQQDFDSWLNDSGQLFS